MIKLDFSGCDYAEDFEAIIDANQVFEWMPQYGYTLWFKAYDTSCRETDREIELNDMGFEYDCYVYVLDDVGLPVDMSYKSRAGYDKADAEKMLYKMAEDIAKDQEIVEHLRKVVDVIESAVM